LDKRNFLRVTKAQLLAETRSKENDIDSTPEVPGRKINKKGPLRERKKRKKD